MTDSAKRLLCGATAVFWPDDEACDATCILPYRHIGTIHEDEILGEWDESELNTYVPDEPLIRATSTAEGHTRDVAPEPCGEVLDPGLGGDVQQCSRPRGHDGYHRDVTIHAEK